MKLTEAKSLLLESNVINPTWINILLRNLAEEHLLNLGAPDDVRARIVSWVTTVVKNRLLNLPKIDPSYNALYMRVNQNDVDDLVNDPAEYIGAIMKDIIHSPGAYDELYAQHIGDMSWVTRAKHDDLELFIPYDDSCPFYDELMHILDYLSSEEGRRVLPDNVSRMSYAEAVRRANEWISDDARPVGKDAGGYEVLRKYDNGYKWVKLLDKAACNYEGSAMGHCVGSYAERVTSAELIIYSLRDAHNEPHVTIESTRDGVTWRQIKGKANKPVVNKYIPYVIDAIENGLNGIIPNADKMSDLDKIGLVRINDKIYKMTDVLTNFTDFASPRDYLSDDFIIIGGTYKKTNKFFGNMIGHLEQKIRDGLLRAILDKEVNGATSLIIHVGDGDPKVALALYDSAARGTRCYVDRELRQRVYAMLEDADVAEKLSGTAWTDHVDYAAGLVSLNGRFFLDDVGCVSIRDENALQLLLDAQKIQLSKALPSCDLYLATVGKKADPTMNVLYSVVWGNPVDDMSPAFGGLCFVATERGNINKPLMAGVAGWGWDQNLGIRDFCTKHGPNIGAPMLRISQDIIDHLKMKDER